MSATTLPATEIQPSQQDVRRDRVATRVAVVLGVIAVMAAATGAAFWPNGSDPNREYLTHTIKRGSLTVSVTEQGTLESSNNTEIKCTVRGFSMVTYVVPTGTVVEEGQELVRLDTKVIEEQHSLTKTNTFIAQATLAQTEANVEKAKIAIDAYEQGRFRSQLQSLEKELSAHKRNLRTARKMYERSKSLFRQGYVTDLEVAGNAFTVTQAELELKVKELMESNEVNERVFQASIDKERDSLEKIKNDYEQCINEMKEKHDLQGVCTFPKSFRTSHKMLGSVHQSGQVKLGLV